MNLTVNYQEFLLMHGPKIVSVLLGAYVLYQLLSFFNKRFVKIVIMKKAGDPKFRDQRIKTVSNVIMRSGGCLIAMIALLMVLRELSLDPSPILASAGILGLALSLGAQAYTKDVIAGLIILIEDQYSEGDCVKLDDSEGEVQCVTLRKTVLCDSKGVVRHVPNGQIKVVSVMPQTRKTRA